MAGLSFVAVCALSAAARAACPPPASNQVVVYQDADASGNCSVLNVGDYPTPPFGAVGNDAISSIVLGAGVTVDLFQNAQFAGNAYHYENGPFTFNLNGWANDDVSSIRIANFSNPPSQERRWTLDYSASATDSASNANSATLDIGTIVAGTTVRLGTCSGGGDLPSATASGDTFVRVFFNGVEQASNDDGCGVASYLSYTAPYTGDITVHAGCFSTAGCSATLEVAADIPDSNGSVSDVIGAFNSIVGNAPNRNKLDFGQNGIVIGQYKNDHLSAEPHFQGIQRIPRTLGSTSDDDPRFVLSGSGNADLYTISFGGVNPNSGGLVGPLPDTPGSMTRVVGTESVGSYYGAEGIGHLGGLQASGRWLGGGVEKGGGAGPSTLWFWDISTTSIDPIVVGRVDNPGGSAGGVALTKLPGQNQGFLMFVAGQSATTAQVWTLTGNFGYADLKTGAWMPGAPVTLPSLTGLGFQNLSFINQDDGELFLVGTVGAGTTQVEEGTDTAVLMKITGDSFSGFTAQQVASKVFTCQFDSSRQCGFNAAAAMFVDSDLNVLRLYASKGYRPDDDRAPMTIVEYF